MYKTVQRRTRALIRNYLTEELVAFNASVPDDASLEDYDLDSGGIVALVLFLEEQFHIEIGDEEITAENLGSVHALVEFVEHKLNMRGDMDLLEEDEKYA
jgi:acyl carrier protein